MLYRLLALVGLPAHLIGRLSTYLLGLLGIRLPVVLLLIGLLGSMTALELWTNYRQLAERPEPREATVAEIVEETERGRIIWLTFTAGITAEPFVRDVPIVDPVGQEVGQRIYHYYLVLDPDDPGVGLIVRSTLDDEHFRERTLTARAIEDAAFIEAALARLEAPPDLEVDPSRYLDEVVDAGSDDEAPQPNGDPLGPGELAQVEDGDQVTVTGRIPAPARTSACAPPEDPAACDPADPRDRWVYLLADADGGTAVVLRSPHAPDAIPVRLDGLMLADTFRMAPVIDSDWQAQLRDDLRYPEQRVLFHGHEPPFRDPDWLGVIVMGGTALLLLVSWLVGYPIFRRTRGRAPVPALAPGEALQAEMHGRLDETRGRAPVDGALGALERMTLSGLVLTLWRYGQVDHGESRRDIERRISEEAGSRDARLVVHAPGRSQLAVVGDRPTRLEAGTVYRVSHSRPALHVEDGRVDLLLIFEEELNRDRAAAAIAREAPQR